MTNKFKHLLCLLCIALSFSLNARADKDRPITTGQLPASARTTLKQCFPKAQVALAKKETGWFDKGYEVIFTNGNKIEFNADGSWKEVECKQGEVPSALVPAFIQNYVRKNYAGFRVVKIERKRTTFEAELSNGLDLTFTSQGQLLKIDD